MFSVNRSGGRVRSSSFDDSSSCPRSLSRDSYGMKRVSSEERKSGNGGLKSGVRNSLSNDSKGVIKETRPLTDKAYQKRKVTEIIEFLEENGFNIPMTPVKLMQPSKKDFEMIFEFLYCFLDPSFCLKNLEEDAPRVLKYLGYPFIPIKSAFTYVAKTNFSSLLGVLLYLLDLVKITLNIDFSALYKTADVENPDEHGVILHYILECQQSGVENDEMIEVFENIIRTRSTEDKSALEQEKEVYNEKFSKVKNELEKIDFLQIETNYLNTCIKQYEEYFNGMNKRMEKRESSISKSADELLTKKSLLEDLRKSLCQRQAIYDAQGFDGKKQLYYYDEQKKELNNTLEKEATKLKELQDECWDLEISYSRAFDKGVEMFKGFNQAYTQIKDFSKAVIQTLQSIRNPEGLMEVSRVLNSFRFEFPEFPQQFNNSTISFWNNIQDEDLEDISKKINTTNVIIRHLLSTKSQELTEIEMKNLQLSSKLKCMSSVELQKENELILLEKQAVEEVKAFEKKCDEDLKQLDELRKEIREKEEHFNKLKSDLLEVEKLKNSKTEMLDKYLEQQKIFFDQLVSKIDLLVKESETQGEKITSAFEEMLKMRKLRD